MKAKQIIFVEPNKASLLDCEVAKPTENQVLVKTAFSTISAGTERANLIGDVNISPNSLPTSNIPVFPRTVGYSYSGVVEEVGKNVTRFKKGDRVIGMWSKHASYNLFDDFSIASFEAFLTFTAFLQGFSLQLYYIKKKIMSIGFTKFYL